jgi:hypothetical protein
MNGFITPKLEHVLCPSANEIFADERLRRLLPDALYFSVGVDEEAIAACLLNAGCVRVTANGDQVVFTGWAMPLRATWEKCLEITGHTRQLVFDIIEGPA